MHPETKKCAPGPSSASSNNGRASPGPHQPGSHPVVGHMARCRPALPLKPIITHASGEPGMPKPRSSPCAIEGPTYLHRLMVLCVWRLAVSVRLPGLWGTR